MKNNLKRLREMKGLEQTDVANDLEISLSTYRSWEQGSRGLNGEKLIMLAEYFGETTDTILGTPFSRIESEEPLTDKEQSLVQLYRQLDGKQQDALLTVIQAMVS